MVQIFLEKAKNTWNKTKKSSKKSGIRLTFKRGTRGFGSFSEYFNLPENRYLSTYSFNMNFSSCLLFIAFDNKQLNSPCKSKHFCIWQQVT